MVDGRGNRAIKVAGRERVKRWIEAGFSKNDVALGSGVGLSTVRKFAKEWGLEFGTKRLPEAWHRVMRRRLFVPMLLEAQWLDFKRRETKSCTPTRDALWMSYTHIPEERRLKWWQWLRDRREIRNKCWVADRQILGK